MPNDPTLNAPGPCGTQSVSQGGPCGTRTPSPGLSTHSVDALSRSSSFQALPSVEHDELRRSRRCLPKDESGPPAPWGLAMRAWLGSAYPVQQRHQTSLARRARPTPNESIWEFLAGAGVCDHFCDPERGLANFSLPQIPGEAADAGMDVNRGLRSRRHRPDPRGLSQES